MTPRLLPLAAFAVWLAVPAVAAGQSAGVLDTARAEAEALRAGFAADLRTLADEAETIGLSGYAEGLRTRADPPPRPGHEIP